MKAYGTRYTDGVMVVTVEDSGMIESVQILEGNGKREDFAPVLGKSWEQFAEGSRRDLGLTWTEVPTDDSEFEL